MNHLGTCLLHTSSLILRPFSMADASAVYHNWGSDPEVVKFMPWPLHHSVTDSENVLLHWVSQYEKKEYYNWAITVKTAGDSPVGAISIVQQDDALAMVEIGYTIGTRWWKQGIASEALARVVHFLFAEVGVNRIQARHDAKNPNSGKVMVKCGLQYEGTLREAGKNNQGVCDMKIYSMLKREYKL